MGLRVVSLAPTHRFIIDRVGLGCQIPLPMVLSGVNLTEALFHLRPRALWRIAAWASGALAVAGSAAAADAGAAAAAKAARAGSAVAAPAGAHPSVALGGLPLSVSIARRGGRDRTGPAPGALALRDPRHAAWRARVSTEGFWAPRLDGARLLHAAHCGGGARCVLVELEGASQPYRPSGYCGAGDERAWLWARIERDGRVAQRSIHPIESCIQTIVAEGEGPGSDAPGQARVPGVLSRVIWETVPRLPASPTREETRALEYDTRTPGTPPRERVLRTAPLMAPRPIR